MIGGEDWWRGLAGRIGGEDWWRGLVGVNIMLTHSSSFFVKFSG